ncbi:hypothetical protein QVD17_36670 [Tagetes erecta]|uniref:S-protein homolog n=1 Tax=Tagetes erecta TaxID=13708 RepID=A0AAD8JV32_TARER|nr:hypothetical protein QVD17_36670 [Tagetes erecta]
MNKLMKCFALLLFLVAPPYCLAIRPPTRPQSSRYADLHIKDKDLKNLKFWCESLDAVLGDVILQPGQETVYQILLDWEYDCHFKWQSREKTVGYMGSDCVEGKCIWEVRNNGFWFYDHNKKHWIKKEEW